MTRTRFSSEEPSRRPLYSGLPAAASFEQSILFAQLELLRRLDSSRIQVALAVPLGKRRSQF